MSRALIILYGSQERQTATEWIKRAPAGCRVEFKHSTRTTPANAKMWAMLTDVARQVEWYGHKLSPDDWKTIFTSSLRNALVVPGIDAGTLVPLGMRTSKMTKQEFSDLLELIGAFAAERGVKFSEPVAEPLDAQH